MKRNRFSLSFITNKLGLGPSRAGSSRTKRRGTLRRLFVQTLDDRRVLAAIPVTTVADVVDDTDGETSLREAIVAANLTSEVDVITFSGAAFSSPAQIDLALGQFDILEPLEISGPGTSALTLNGGTNSRIFNIESATGDVLISGMTLINGATQGDNSNVSGTVETTQSGGAIRVQSTSPVTLRDLTVQNSQTFGARASGGAIFIGGGDVTLETVSLIGNRVNGAFSQGAGLSISGGTLAVKDSVISTNIAAGQLGGGGGIQIENGATVVVQDSTLHANQTIAISSDGGAIKSDNSGLVIERSRLTDNLTSRVDSSGAGIAINGGVLSVHSSTLSGNIATETEASGGGILAVSAVLNIEGSSLIGNRINGASSRGAGIYASQTNLSILNTTFSANEALAESSTGGALFLDGGSQATLVHTTMTLNSASTGGGGLALGDTLSQAVMNNSIIAGNGGNSVAPDILSNFSSAQLNLRFSLVGDLRGSGLSESPTQDASGNFIGDPLGGGIIDPLLQPLADNAGQTLTHQPLASSPVINAGNDALSVDRNSQILVADQRGLPFHRANGSGDMGAFEVQPPQPVVVDWAAPSNVLAGTVLGENELNALFDVPGTIVYSPALGTILASGENQVLTATIVPDDMVFYVTTVVTVEIDVVSPLDYGDAPASYQTLLNDNGPRHGASSLFLGADINIELNATPSDAADSDASDNGVVFATPIIASSLSTATLLIEASSAGKLDAWIDFDRDGVFDPTADHLSPGTSIDLVSGINEILVTVPPGSVPGATYARFRISTDGGLGPGGAALIGEVEDYAITLLDAASANDLAVSLVGVRTTLSSQGNHLVLTLDGSEYFRAPKTAVGELLISTDEFSNVFTIDQLNGENTIPSGGITFDGGDRINTIRLQGAFELADFSINGNIRAQNVDAIDLADAEMQVVRLDSAAARLMDGDAGGIVIVGGSEDEIEFGDPNVWKMTQPEVVAGIPFSVVSLQDPLNPSGTFVQVDFGSGWQNIAEPSDVNNDNQVTALDALVIINEIARNTYSDEDTGALGDPSFIDPWPGVYYDQDNNGNVTALDALRVINQLARSGNSSASGEAEATWEQNTPSKKEEDEAIRDAVIALF